MPSYFFDTSALVKLYHFVCADRVLCDIAEMVGLQVINPTVS